MRSPVIPGNASDRTGASRVVKRAEADIDRRADGIRREALEAFGRIRHYSINDAGPLVAYGATPEQMQELDDTLRDIAERWYLEGQKPGSLWWSAYVTEAAGIGAAQAAIALSRLSDAYAAVRSVGAIIADEGFRTRVGMAQVKSYSHWTGMAAQTKADLSSVIAQAIADGLNPRDVRDKITERIEVSASLAKQFAQTDITDTLRQAKWSEDDYARDRLGIRTGELWTSALKGTTRPWHASRHGRVYTTEECRLFYSARGNRYNCYCSSTTCLLDDDGNPMLTDKLKSAMSKERADWNKDNLGV